MKRFSIAASLVLAVVIGHAQTPSTLPLVQPPDLVYTGAFRTPKGPVGDPAGLGLAYSNEGLAYHAANDSLFVGGHIYSHATAELAIPIPVISTSLTAIPVAAVKQPLVDLYEGKVGNLLAGGAPTRSPSRGGLLVFNNRLIATAYDVYAASPSTSERLSHFTSGLTLATAGDVGGAYTVGDELKTGWVSGYMGTIPPAWRAAFGGPAMTGNCCLNIITRTSPGPAASVFNPDDLGVKTPVPATPAVEYSMTNQLEPYVRGQANIYFTPGDEIHGIVFPDGTRSVLFFGRKGTGKFCYGIGIVDPAHVLGTDECFDPIYTSKGNHAYPYVHYVWAYDANDLVSVRQGLKHPWEVKPYAVWTLPLPFGRAGFASIQGATYDPATQRIFVSQNRGESDNPVIHVFTVASGGTAPSPTPTPPPPPPAPTPPPAPVPPIVVSAVIAVKTCALSLSDVPPDAAGGWSV